MVPEHHAFGGGSPATVLHPVVAVWMLIAIVLIFTLPRHKAIAPFLLAFFSIPVGQVLVLAGVHLTMHQILILTVLMRMVSFRGAEGRFAGGFNALDRVVVLWAVSTFIVNSLQWMETQATIKLLGDLIVNLGGYLAVRFLIHDGDTLRRTIRVFALICLIQGACMMSELFTYQNVFAFAGAHPPTFREGHIRAEGAIGNLWAGAMAGTLIPLFFWLWRERNSRMAACAGLAGAAAMVIATHASTSTIAFGASMIGLCFWPLRKQMRLVRWGIVAMLVGLHLAMHGPVWSLIEKIDITGGSSSYHRYMLVDNTIRHFSDWWLLGCKHPEAWGFDMWDLCNQFVAAAITGGLITLIVFLMIYIRNFRAVGNARKDVEGDHRQEWFLWCLGSALFANAVASFGINYLVHLIICFFSLLACISVAVFKAKRPAEANFGGLDDAPLAPVPTFSNFSLRSAN